MVFFMLTYLPAGRSSEFPNRHRHRVAASETERRDALRKAAILERVQQRRQDPRPGRPDGMPQRDGTAPDVVLGALALSIGAALIAGIYPAYRAARAQPALAMREE